MVKEPKKKMLFLVPVHISYESYVSPPKNARTVIKNGRIVNSLATDLPLGLLSMSAYLKKHYSLDIRLVDFNVEVSALDEFDYPDFASFARKYLAEHFVADFSPDIIGISSLFSPSYQNFIELGAAVKELWPDSFLVGGGNIPTNSYQHIHQTGGFAYFDALCFGEGEKPMLGLIEAESPQDYVERSESWITARKLEDFFIPKHDFIVDLDEIPFYDYALCDHGRHSLNPVMTSYAAHSDSTGYHIMTSRGCPFHCTFCASHQVHGRKMRYHSTDRVFADIRRLVKDYGAQTLIFQDDHFMADKARVLTILGFIEQEKLNAIFQNGLTLYSLDYETLSAFKRAGVNQLVLPLESGSEKVLKHQMKKPLKMSISRQVTEDCRKLDIYTNANVLIGLPGETRQDIEEARLNLVSRGLCQPGSRQRNPQDRLGKGLHFGQRTGRRLPDRRHQHPGLQRRLHSGHAIRLQSGTELPLQQRPAPGPPGHRRRRLPQRAQPAPRPPDGQPLPGLRTHEGRRY